MKEIWKDIIGYEGKYQISNTGKVKSLSRPTNAPYGTRIISTRILKQRNLKKGYQAVNLKKDTKTYKTHTIHRLVAIAFTPNPQNKPQVNHIDGNKLNNNYWNLEWCTNQENRNHAMINNLHLKGEKTSWSKLNELQVRVIRRLKDDLTSKQIGSYFEVAPSTIDNILHKRSWKHI